MIYYTSDLHFNHANILDYCKRPFSTVHEMNVALTENWNKRVQPEDIVFIIGDFTMGDRRRTKEFADRLNGQKVLILGNHDKLKYCEEAFPGNVTKAHIRDTNDGFYLLIHRPEDAHTYIQTINRKPLFVLCGHVHEKWAHQTIDDILYINVGVDAPGRNDYTPHTLQELLDSTK